MPFGREPREEGIALALSGGGFRATLFHLGAVWRLNELGYLAQLKRISSVSGGSITSGALAVSWAQLKEQAFSMDAFHHLIAEPLRTFCSRTIDAWAIGEGALLPWKRVSEAVEEEYRKHLLGNTSLAQLPDEPRFVFNSTNFATGRSFRFSKPYAGDYRIGLIPDPQFPVSLAVTASSAFPPALSPVIIKARHSDFQKTEGADLFTPEYHERLVLTDGGVYDNLGLETVWNRYDTVLVSDAGAPFGFVSDVETAWHKQALRALDIATEQARSLRKRALVADYSTQNGIRKGAYWGIETDPDNYRLDTDILACTPDRRKELASIRTRLNHFNEQEQCELINWGYAICDTAMRKHVLPAGTPKGTWPYPNFALDRFGASRSGKS